LKLKVVTLNELISLFVAPSSVANFVSHISA